MPDTLPHYAPSPTPAPTGCWIVVLNYNGTHDTMRCLASLASVHHRATVLLVDNGSADDVLGQARQRFPWVATLSNGENLGYAGGNNRGLVRAFAEGATHAILLNNDTEVAPDLVDALMAVSAARPDVGIVGPVISYMEEPGTVRTDGCLFNRAGTRGFFERLPVALDDSPPQVVEVDIVNGCCMMVSAACAARIGLIEERFFLVHEESDYCLRAARAGLKSVVLGRVLVWHKGSSSFARAGNGLQRYFDVRNLALLLRRHGNAMPGSRSLRDAWTEYLAYSYFVYCLERERGTVASSEAVLHGLHDAAFSRFGPRVDRSRPFVPIIRAAFSLKRRLARSGPR